ncbi:hypothetical protein K2X33_10235 [bacterium]|nr:hypothetical protein [bacterium]
MSIETLFPMCDVVRTASDELPTDWNESLSLPKQQALNRISDFMCLAASSPMRRLMAASLEIGAIVPRGKKGRHDKRLWKLGILYSQSRVLLFSFPHTDFLRRTIEMPSQYRELVSKLGAFGLDQYSGQSIWPSAMEKLCADIRLFLSAPSSAKILVPFYDHKTGDFDCWLNGEADEVWTFDHESCVLHLYCAGGFSAWIEKRFCETYSM